MKENQELIRLRQNQPLSARQQTRLILQLSLPAVLSQLSVVVMQLIDAGMVGRLSSLASASIGLVSSSTWLINGAASGSVYGFSVQTAQKIGAREQSQARSLCLQGLKAVLITGLVFASAGVFIASDLPVWMRGEPGVLKDASAYFRIFCLFLPFTLINSWAVQMLQSAGNAKVPSIVQIIMCLLDVLFNLFLIFPSVGPFKGADLGVAGAALGTGLSSLCASVFLLWFVLKKEPWFKGSAKGRFSRQTLKRAFQIGAPISVEQLISCSAYVAFTYIVSSLGSTAVAANSFGITVESVCYMPGYGIAFAATGIIGQCMGAGRRDLMKSLSIRMCMMGIAFMSLSGIVMFAGARVFMQMLSSDAQVVELGARILRIEAFAEPMYGASIIVIGILRGEGDTLIPTILNFLSMWCIRIPLAWLLCSPYGLPGVWFAMMFELNCRGLLFLLRLAYKQRCRTGTALS